MQAGLKHSRDVWFVNCKCSLGRVKEHATSPHTDKTEDHGRGYQINLFCPRDIPRRGRLVWHELQGFGGPHLGTSDLRFSPLMTPLSQCFEMDQRLKVMFRTSLNTTMACRSSSPWQLSV
eukprot:2602246-Amphidinium_carterae.1